MLSRDLDYLLRDKDARWTVGGQPILALAAAIASLTSGLMQWWLWRWQAETRISRG